MVQVPVVVISSFQRRDSNVCHIIITTTSTIIIMMIIMMMMMMIRITTTTNTNSCMSNAFTLPILHYPSVSSSSSSSSLLILKLQPTKEQRVQSYESDPSSILHRRMMIQQLLLIPILIILPSSIIPTTIVAAAVESSSTKQQQPDKEESELELLNTQIHEAFMKLQNELDVNNNNSGIYILQQYILNENYNAILEYTKTYDPKLRKGMMKPIQQLLIQKVNIIMKNNNNKNNKVMKEQKIKYIQTQTTTYMNAITFDLIGMNRYARPTKKNQQPISIQKYFNELQNDIQSFLQLEHFI